MKFNHSFFALRSLLIVVVLAASSTALAQTSVTNEAFITPPTTVIDPIPENNQDAETNPVVQFAPALSTSKALSSNADEDGSGNVTLGDTLTYTLSVTNNGNVTLTGVTLADSLIATLNCTPLQPATLEPTGQLVCTGEYVVQPGDVTAGRIVNTATGDSDQTGPDSAEVTTPVFAPEVSVSKTANPIAGSSVTAGQTITYTLTAVIADAPLTATLELSDTLGLDLAFGSVTSAGAFSTNTAGNPLLFTLPSGTAPGSYSVSYNATVNNDATGTVGNSVVITGPGGDPDPECPSCTTSHPVVNPQVEVNKASNPVSGSIVSAGQSITYTLTAVVSSAPLTAALELSDTLDADLTFGSVTNPGAYAADTVGSPLVFTLPSGTAPGSYSVSYTATVNNDATGTVGNSVVITGPGGDPDPECPSCTTSHPVFKLIVDKSVTRLSSTGPNTWLVGFELLVENVGDGAGSYTLTDTLGFTATGLVLGDQGTLSTTGGTLNPALSDGVFTPQNGVALQISATGLAIAAGAQHRYWLEIPFGVIEGQLQNSQCNGTPGNGLFNEASVKGSVTADDTDCISFIEGSDVAINLLKTVELGIDNNSNNFGDVGDVLFYTFEVTNTGADPLTDIQLIDLLVDDLACAPQATDGEPIQVLPWDGISIRGFERGGLGTLNAGEALICAASYTLTAQDVARRRVENTATALGTGPLGEVVSSVSTAIYTAFQ